jgi:hypothetical protein
MIGALALPDADAPGEVFVHFAGSAGEHAGLHVGLGPAGRKLELGLGGRFFSGWVGDCYGACDDSNSNHNGQGGFDETLVVHDDLLQLSG